MTFCSIVALSCWHARRKLWSRALDDRTGESGSWLQDLLPKYVPTARVMLFTRECGAMDERLTPSAKPMKNAAEALVYYLTMKRQDCKNIPIVFICHGLDTLIAKQALAIAASIANSTALLVCFGAPLRDTKGVGWESIYNLLHNGHCLLPTPISFTCLRGLNDYLERLTETLNDSKTWFRQFNVYQEQCMKSPAAVSYVF